MDQLPKIGIVYLSFHSQPFLSRAVEALVQNKYPMDRLELFIVDNFHPKHGASVEHIEKEIIPRFGNKLPTITLLPQADNKGFAGGNNIGINAALAAGCEYVYLHNQDGFMAPDCLQTLVAAMKKRPNIAALQSLIVLYPEIEQINSAGNNLHYLGFGYCGEFRKKIKETQSFDSKPFGYASGAGLLLRADLLKQHGLLDQDFFAYHEDLEYSARLRFQGYEIALCPQSIFYHEYEFSRNNEKFYLMERNRYAFIVMYYRWRTIFLLLPIAVLLEAGMLLVALQQGWLKQKMRVCWYWLRLSSWQLWLEKRRHVQGTRKISDKMFLANTVSSVEFDSKMTNNWLLQRVGNPLLKQYWKIINRCI
jgi:GT2 family glycosyltransferase